MRVDKLRFLLLPFLYTLHKHIHIYRHIYLPDYLDQRREHFYEVRIVFF